MARPLTTFQLLAGALVAVTLGALASAGLVAERVSGGNETLALCLQLTTFALTVLVVGLVRPLALNAASSARKRVASLVGVQLLGVLAGVALTHAMVAMTHPSAGLRETPTQLVNDAMLGVGLVLLVWSVVGISCALRLGMAIAAFALTGLYRLTATSWHIDAISFPVLTIQQFVTVGIVAVAAGLMVIDWFSPDAEYR